MAITLPRVRRADIANARVCLAIDAFVRGHPNSTPFHLTAWSKAIAKGCRQRSHYFIAEADESIMGVLPLTEVHSPLFGRALISSGFAVGGGVLAYDSAIGDLLVQEAVALARQLSCTTIELKGGALPEGWHDETSSYLGFTRPLAADDEAELLQIPRKQRAEVRKALESEMTIETGREARDLSAHYACYAESVRNLGTPVFPRVLFSAVLAAFDQDADILTIRHKGAPIASVLSLYHRGSVMPYWGGGIAAARSLRANELMYYALMNHGRRRGCTIFDFGRSKIGTGAAAYKKNWGFEGVPLAYAKLALDGRPPRSINPLDAKFSLPVRVWQKLPLGVANRIGPLIARGLG